MATTPYTDVEQIVMLAGQIAVDLRVDDAVDQDAEDALLARAIDYGSNQIEFYCSKYAPVELAANGWVRDAATFIAVKWLCLHRLNNVPASIKSEWEEVLQPQLVAVQQGKATIPRASTSRNPVSVTNYAVDLRRTNNQIRIDPARSTGQAQGYKRPRDPNAPDQR